MLPSLFLKFVGVCLLAIGVYDTSVYRYALTKSLGSFDFFGRELPAKHPLVKIGFSVVLLFYYTIGLLLLISG